MTVKVLHHVDLRSLSGASLIVQLPLLHLTLALIVYSILGADRVQLCVESEEMLVLSP